VGEAAVLGDGHWFGFAGFSGFRTSIRLFKTSSKRTGGAAAQRKRFRSIPNTGWRRPADRSWAMVDRVGAKNAGIIVQLVVITGLALAWIFGLPNYPATVLMGLVLGFAGASFAVALPQAGRW
jgi:hypothetical protein